MHGASTSSATSPAVDRAEPTCTSSVNAIHAGAPAAEVPLQFLEPPPPPPAPAPPRPSPRGGTFLDSIANDPVSQGRLGISVVVTISLIMCCCSSAACTIFLLVRLLVRHLAEPTGIRGMWTRHPDSRLVLTVHLCDLVVLGWTQPAAVHVTCVPRPLTPAPSLAETIQRRAPRRSHEAVERAPVCKRAGAKS